VRSLSPAIWLFKRSRSQIVRLQSRHSRGRLLGSLSIGRLDGFLARRPLLHRRRTASFLLLDLTPPELCA